MNQEYQYPILITAVFIGSTASLAALLQKYTSLTVVHFVQICRWVGLNFFSSGVHYAGFFVLLIVCLTAVAFLLKAVFSLVKTQRKINCLLVHQTDHIPRKLLSLSRRQREEGYALVVIDIPASHAFSFGIFSKKLLISTGLIERLSEKQLEAVLLHEFYHLRRRHVPVLLAGEVMAAALFFLPVLKDWVGRMRLIFEEEADVYAASRQKTDLHLRTALAKTTAVENEYELYPTFTFARRGSSPSPIPGRILIRKATTGLLFSVGVAVAGLLLLVVPTRAHAAHPSSSYSCHSRSGIGSRHRDY